jgi:hypothetical protein
MPLVRPLFLADPDAPEAWANWWAYLYGPDLASLEQSVNDWFAEHCDSENTN